MMKKQILLAMLLIVVMVLPACAPAEPACTSEDVFCVGLVTDGGKVSDQSFNQAAWEGVEQAEAALSARIQYIETADAEAYAQNIAVFGDQGYDVIVTVGFALREATVAAAAKYPDTDFIGVDQFQPETRDGVAGLLFPEDQAGFLAGTISAMMSKGNKIGAVCGADVAPTDWRFVEGYKAGAAFVDQFIGVSTEVITVYRSGIGSAEVLTDPEWGAESARAIMNQGADTIFSCGGDSGNKALTAAAQAGAYAIGVNTDQYLALSEAAPRMLSSALKLITPGVLELIKLSRAGQFPSGNYLGDVGYAPFHDLEDEVPASVKKMMEQISAGLLNGSIKTNVPLVRD